MPNAGPSTSGARTGRSRRGRANRQLADWVTGWCTDRFGHRRLRDRSGLSPTRLRYTQLPTTAPSGRWVNQVRTERDYQKRTNRRPRSRASDRAHIWSVATRLKLPAGWWTSQQAALSTPIPVLRQVPARRPHDLHPHARCQPSIARTRSVSPAKISRSRT
jgi:hypothetical protein